MTKTPTPAGLGGLSGLNNPNTQGNVDAKSTEEVAADQMTEDSKVQYTSHPIANYHLGRFVFVNGVLTLDDDADIAEFERMLNDKNLPAIEKSRVKKIDAAAADAFVRERLAAKGGATKEIDSSVGERGKQALVGQGSFEGGSTGAIDSTTGAPAEQK